MNAEYARFVHNDLTCPKRLSNSAIGKWHEKCFSSLVSRYKEEEAMPIARESLILMLICVADAISTYWLIQGGLAGEMNPVMDWVLGYGWFAFFAVKGATVVLAVSFAEWVRRRDPGFAQRWMRTAAWLYVSVWTIGVLLGNFIIRV
jgi:hypothetical protein